MQHTLEEAFGCRLVAPRLQQHVEFGTVLVDCSPRSLANTSSKCHMMPGLRRAALARWAKPVPNLSHQRRIVS
jgi:hypothetical protein